MSRKILPRNFFRVSVVTGGQQWKRSQSVNSGRISRSLRPNALKTANRALSLKEFGSPVAKGHGIQFGSGGRPAGTARRAQRACRTSRKGVPRHPQATGNDRLKRSLVITPRARAQTCNSAVWWAENRSSIQRRTVAGAACWQLAAQGRLAIVDCWQPNLTHLILAATNAVWTVRQTNSPSSVWNP